GRGRWRTCAVAPAALDSFDEPLWAAPVELPPQCEGLALELVASALDHGDLRDLGQMVVEAVGVPLDGDPELRQIVVVAEEVSERVCALGQLLHLLRCRGPQDLFCVPQILHAFAPLVKVLIGWVS